MIELSKEVRILRLKLLEMMASIDYTELNTIDRCYLSGLLVHSEAHLRDSAEFVKEERRIENETK